MADTFAEIEIGEIGEIRLPEYIRLISDRGNLSQNTHYTVREGYEIVRAYLDIKKQKHTTNQYIKSIVQPDTIAVSKDVQINFEKSFEGAKAEAEAKGVKISGFGELEKEYAKVAASQVISATTNGQIYVHAWADGRKYSSKDGVIIADLVIELVRRPTDRDIDALIADVVRAVDDNTQEGVNAALATFKAFSEKAEKSKAKADPNPIKPKDKD